MGLDMNKKNLALVIVFILLSCTNWKANYYKQQIELDKCLNTPPIITTEYKETKVVSYDTITVENQIPVPYIFEQPVTFERKDKLFFTADSSKVYITIINELKNNKLIQLATLDSLIIHKKIITKTKVVENTIIKTDYTKGLLLGIVFSIIVLLFLIFKK